MNLFDQTSPVSPVGASRLVRNAVLTLEVAPVGEANFTIKQANPEAEQLIKPVSVPLIGATLAQLPAPFNTPELRRQLQQVYDTGTSTHIQLRHAQLNTQSVSRFDCQLLKIDPRLLVLSVVAAEPEPVGMESLAEILEAMPTGLILFRAIRDTNQTIIDFQAVLCNQIGAAFTRQTRQDILSKPLSQRYENIQAHALFQQCVAVVVARQPHHERLHLPNQAVWLDIAVVPYEDGMLVSFLDVTQGQKTVSLLESIINSSPAAVRYYEAIRDESGHIIDFMTGMGNELVAYQPYRPTPSTTGKRLLELYPYLRANGLFARYVAVVESGQSDRFETTYQAADRLVWFECMAVPHANGFVLTTLDITARKEAQLAQQQQADLIQGVLNSSASSIVVLEPVYGEPGTITDFRIRLANPATGRLFSLFLGSDFTSEELLSQTLRSLFPPVKERALFAALMAVVTTGQPIHTPVDYPDLRLTYDYDLAPYQDGVLMITTDITPLRVYQQQLEANNTALSRSNEYLQQFAYVASHDLQEPLRKIQSFGDMLLTQYAGILDDVGRDLLRRQQNAAARMQGLVKDLLAYSRLSTQPLPSQPVSLQALIQEVLNDLDATIEQTGARVQVGRLPTLNGQPTQLRQLLQNLMTNALKFSKPGQPPQVRIDAKLLTVDELPASLPGSGPGTWVALSVTDDGIGFDTAYGARIFELFQRLHGLHQYTGTGIGLAIVKKVVENHGGLITAESQVGQGATFTVYLPVEGA